MAKEDTHEGKGSLMAGEDKGKSNSKAKANTVRRQNVICTTVFVRFESPSMTKDLRKHRQRPF
jgi:hypothetical protein